MKYLLTNQQTKRLEFRSVSLDDFDQWIEFFKDPSSFKYWDAVRHTADEDCKGWYDRQFDRYNNDKGGMNALIEKSTGKLVGHAGLLIQQVDNTTEMEVAYSLLGQYRNKGYATEAAMKCRAFAFQNKWAESLISIISLSNEPSARVAVKNGMAVDKQTVYHANSVNIYRVNAPR